MYMSQKGGDARGPLAVRIGDHELVIRRRYELASILNDLMIGVWFLVGSFLFLSPTTTHSGTWLFILGSAQLLIRPLIRLTRQVHLRRIATPGAPVESDRDF